MIKREPFLLYLLYGSEDFLIEKEIYKIKRLTLKKDFSDFNYQSYHLKDIELQEVVNTANTIPVMSQVRMVVLNGIDRLKKGREEEILTAYIKNPSPSTTLVLVANTARIDRSSSVYREVEKMGCIKMFRRLSHAQLSKVIQKEVRDAGKVISIEAKEKLLSLTGGNLRTVMGELKKLILYVGGNADIDIKDVEDCTADVKVDTVFDLANAIGMRDGSMAVRVLDKVSSEIPVRLLGALSGHFRVLWRLKGVKRGEGHKGDNLLHLPGIPHYRLKSYLEQSKRFTKDDLFYIFQGLKRVEMEMKSGRLPFHLSINRFIFDLFGLH